MQPASVVRRQVYLLSVRDFADCPVWEFCSDEEGVEGQDEATVKPSDERQVPGFSPGVYVVAADAKFADGTSASGYIYSGQPNDWGCIQPNVITQSGQVSFWLGSLQFIKSLETSIARKLQALGKSPEQVFPVTFKTTAKINGDFLRVDVKGFMARDMDSSVKIFG